MRWGFALLCVLLMVVVGKLVYLQGVDRGNYATAALKQRVGQFPLHALRGQILDRDATVLAYTSNAQDITADPTQITADATRTQAAMRLVTASALAPLIGRSEAEIVALLSKPGRYSVLATALSPSLAARVEGLRLPGIYTRATTAREYPGHTTAANILGMLHSDGTPVAGIEQQFDSILAGQDGKVTYASEPDGTLNPTGPNERTPAVDGGTVRLTIDQDLQFVVQQLADSATRQSEALGTQVAVLSRTGEVLALASNGTYDASEPDSIDRVKSYDPPIQTVFEPGSVQKVVTFAAALDKGIITPSTVMKVGDSFDGGDVIVHDAWGHPVQPFTATGILAQSSNVGTLQIATKVGAPTWLDYEKKFGIGTRTGIELPGESAGILHEMSEWSSSTYDNLPIGQGEAMTVLQMAGMYQAVANDGVRIPPRITQSVTTADGHTRVTPRPDGITVMKPETAKTLRTMLESVILPGGTGTKAAVPGYRVAGKTGTAQKPDPAHGGAYSSWMYWDTFVGMAPSDDPQFIVAIMVDTPAHGLHGGDVAAPLFNEIASYELQHAHIPPSGTQATHVPLLACDAKLREIHGSSLC